MSIERQHDHETTPALTALLYCRVSSRKQLNEGSGLDSQEHRCRQHAAGRGYPVENVFLESVSGGLDIADRPALQTLLHYLDAMKNSGNHYVVIFDDHKRFDRHTEMHLRLKKEMAKRGALIEYLNFTVDNTPEGEFIETMLAAQAQLERQQNGRQTREKTIARLEKGYWACRAPVGYKYIQGQGGGRELVPDEPLATIVKDALEGFACGRFGIQAEVKRFLDAQPAFPKNPATGDVRKQKVASMLGQILYAGYVVSPAYGVTLRKGKHEPLISLETFEKIQERRKGNHCLPARKDISKDFPLRGAVHCHDCEKPLRGAWSKGKTKTYAYYVCQTKACSSYGKSIARHAIEDEFESLLQTIQPSKAVFSIVKAMFKDAWNIQAKKTASALTGFKREAAKAEKEINTLITRITQTSSRRVIQAYEDRIDTLEKEKLIYEEKTTETTPQKQSFEKFLELSLIFLSNPYKLWVNGSFEVKRTVLKLALTGPIYYDRNKGARTPLKALPHKGFVAIQGGLKQNGAVEKTRTSTAK